MAQSRQAQAPARLAGSCERPLAPRIRRAGIWTAVVVATILAATLRPAPAGTAPGQSPCRHLAVIVHEGNTLRSISLDRLAALFTGEETHWPDGRPAVIVTAPRGSDLRRAFKRRVLSGRDRRATIPGSPVPFHPLELPPDRAQAYVALFKNAAAYIWADTFRSRHVRDLDVDGLEAAGADGVLPRRQAAP